MPESIDNSGRSTDSTKLDNELEFELSLTTPRNERESTKKKMVSASDDSLEESQSLAKTATDEVHSLRLSLIHISEPTRPY